MELTKEKLKEYFDEYDIECDINTHGGYGHIDDSFHNVFKAIKDLIKDYDLKRQ